MNGRFKGDLPDRTYQFAGMILDLLDLLPQNNKGWIVARQLGKSGTSVGANIAEADEALTDAEFTHRCSIARKETAESRYWLRLCRDKLQIRSSLVEQALNESDEFLRVLVTIVRRMHARTARVSTAPIDADSS